MAKFNDVTAKTNGEMDQLQHEINDWCSRKGWNDQLVDRTFGDWCSLFHSEISEAYEDHRDHKKANEIYYELKTKELGEVRVNESQLATILAQIEDAEDKHKVLASVKPCGIPIEMADLVIRVLHFAAHAGFSLSEMIKIKMDYNEKRPYRHGGKRT